MNRATRAQGASGRSSAAQASWRQGLALARKSRWREAEAAFAQATRCGGDDALYWTNLAHARAKLGRVEPAVEAARRAVAIDGADPAALTLLAHGQLATHRLDEAVETIAALERGGHADAAMLTRCADALCALHRLPEAVEAAMRALRLLPHHAGAHAAMACALERMDMPAEAAECMRTALLMEPGHVERMAQLVHLSQRAADWRRLDADVAALRAAMARAPQTPAGPFAWFNISDSAAEQLDVNRRYVRAQFGAIAPMPLPDARARAGRERIRLGYVSNDFCQHATALLVAEVLERHDRARFEVTLYSHSPTTPSAMRDRLVATADAFVEIGAMSDAAAAERIRADGIDVLVDLKGHTLGARTGIFARRPAPVQVNWLGFPGSMGAPFMDYLVGDPVVTPAQAAHHYDERLALVSGCYQPNDRQRAIGPTPTRAQCGLPEDALVFASFNASYKISPAMFDRWCALLAARPGSVLWLLQWNGAARDNLRREAAGRGVDPDRLVFAPFAPSAEHLGRLRLADLALDTYPVNGHTTTSDALWAGVPVLTLAGEAFAARVAASLVTAAGAPELVTTDGEQYLRAALALTEGDAAPLAALRRRLREARDTAALFDSERCARELGELYAQMAARWLAGQPAGRLSA